MFPSHFFKWGENKGGQVSIPSDCDCFSGDSDILPSLLHFEDLICVLFHYSKHLILRWIHCNIEARLIISTMYFEEENIEDKGLFTFYREQGEKEDQLRRNKKLRK